MRLRSPLGSLHRAKVVARRLGVKLLAADEETLQLDLDTLPQQEQYHIMLPRVRRWIPLTVLRDDPSRGGVGRHVELRVRPLPPADRIAIQAILGSDPMRELLSLVKLWGNAEDPIQLFEVLATEAEENDSK